MWHRSTPNLTTFTPLHNVHMCFILHYTHPPISLMGVSCTFTAPDHPNSVLEKAAVNISIIHGILPPSAIKQMATEHASISRNLNDDSETGSLPFFAAGISLIIHPRNPSVPTVHANYRYFEITDSDSDTESQEAKAWWFGGITDLTPNYLFEDDVVHFHKTLKTACDAYGPRLYPVFKKSCDDYFFIKHRGEHRGVGGIRFDDLSDNPHPLLDSDLSAFPSTSPHRPRTPDQIFTYIKTCATAFLPSYLPILSRRLSTPSDERKRRWQLIRRGRYIEFNLLYDRGTKFGLATPGVQVENVLVSMPESARWEYMEEMGEEEGTEEGRMVEVLRTPREWV
ncbi:hypothetical protein QCA50_007216 [Cerrena zonata]|uniref:coproporphyrinogen oxidase n=1 Tax=Cerrena zonata TaxID=2478898 RepID=A0AAW0GI42_9APHY